MNLTIRPGCRRGQVKVPASKSVAHRMLICAALSHSDSLIKCFGMSKDIRATIDCLGALGAVFSEETDDTIRVSPIKNCGGGLRHMYCGESGSTLRFLLPVAAALGESVVFHPEGRLMERPMDELYTQLRGHGAVIEKTDSDIICSGRLTGGDYSIPGNISSQYISGLLFALPLVSGTSRLEITGKTESTAYIELTERALKTAGIVFEKNGNVYTIPGDQHYNMPDLSDVEGDWSGAAFFLCMGALSPKGVTVTGLDTDSAQGDMRILELIRGFGAEVLVSSDQVTVRQKKMKALTVDVGEIPDLVPVLSVLLLGAGGTSEIKNAGRLRLKESDRIRSTVSMINSLGGHAWETSDGIIISGNGYLTGGTVDVQNDHRIAMAAAVAAALCEKDVIIRDAECADKSYPSFWKDLDALEVI